jgi:hypothetical protein
MELGYVTPDQVRARAAELGKTDYARYLVRRANEVSGA